MRERAARASERARCLPGFCRASSMCFGDPVTCGDLWRSVTIGLSGAMVVRSSSRLKSRNRRYVDRLKVSGTSRTQVPFVRPFFLSSTGRNQGLTLDHSESTGHDAEPDAEPDPTPTRRGGLGVVVGTWTRAEVSRRRGKRDTRLSGSVLLVFFCAAPERPTLVGSHPPQCRYLLGASTSSLSAMQIDRSRWRPPSSSSSS